MVKKKAAMAGLLVIASAAVIAFEWLRPFILVAGFVWVVWIIVSEAAKSRELKAQAQRDAYDTLALLILRGELPGDEMRKMFAVASQLGFQRRELLGRLKQFRESVDLALNSKKRDVAEARMQYAADTALDVATRHQHTASPHIVDEMRSTLAATQAEFQTRLYLNLAKAHMEKADTLKTSKGKIKHLDLAAQAIQEGIVAGRGDMTRLQDALSHVTESIEALG